ncbi:MAG: beta-ketoacyl-[acyl-carrier-protein] synthase family protein [Phycisphaeraceae bacterium]|nr:beta-ketoacyl-[acyl-carrier-protein] synthase family protein [Phycisphaeraceae bacterium]
MAGFSRVVVTGLGPISAVGVGHDVFWPNLLAGRHGFGPITLCDATDSPSKIAAEVRELNLDAIVPAGAALARRLPRPTQFALAAAQLAWFDAAIPDRPIDPERAGIVIGSSVGNLEAMREAAARARVDPSGRIPAHAAFHLFNHSATCLLASSFDLRGPVGTTTCGCNSGIDAVGHAARLIEAGEADVMLAIGTDCEVVPEVLASLNAAGALVVRYNDEPGRASRPFDRGRGGNVIGEGAAALLLESEAHARRRGARIYARCVGYRQDASGSRRYSATEPDEDIAPCARVLRALLADAGWNPADVDAYNANGSSSVVYDRVEARALAAVFGDSFASLPVHSIKSMLGQHGAGSSALQAAAACLAIHTRVLPPTINCEDPDPGCGPLRIRAVAEARPLARVLMSAIGFGGFYYASAAFAAP